MRHTLEQSRINASLATDWNLNATEVETRRIKFGTNNIIETHSNRWIELAIDTAKDPMIWFLIATSIMFAILKNYNQTMILLLATIPLIGMDAFLHWRTQVSTQSLSSRLAAQAIVIRNGIEMRVAAWEIVPGDLVVIPTGTIFPADGIIIDGKNLQVDESTLTGEAFPASKQILSSIKANTTEVAIANEYWGFAGTRLLTGRALLRIAYTGRETLYGQIISSTLHSTQERTPLQQAISKLVLALIVGATVLCVILAFIRYYQGFGFIDALISAATLAVAALPDEFPIVFTFFLGVGVYRLAKKKALVKRAVSVENIGRVTYICSDKTGTITEGYFQLAHYSPSTDFDEQQLLSLAMLASRTESGDLLDLAIDEESSKTNLQHPDCIVTFPFTEDRKRETGIALYHSTHLIAATKGAPEAILSLSTLSSSEKESWSQKIFELASQGYKVIACAQIIMEKTDSPNEPTSHYQFAGLLGFTDPPRKGVKEAIAMCNASNIHVLMITGDHPETARAIACQIGLGNGNPKVILAYDIDEYLLQNHDDYFRHIDVVARAIPSQKLDIVTALQAAGEIVAVTGDGVNDVPALKSSDVGISMGERGTQSAREASDIVLLDDNFDSIVNAIGEGRQLFKNMQLSFKYLLMIHAPFVLSAAIIPLMGYPLLYYPIHIVFIELIIHPTSMLVFQDIPPAKKLEPVARRTKIQFFTKRDWIGIILVGIYTTLLVILTFVYVIHADNPIEHARALSFALLCFTSVAITLGLSGFRTWTARIIVVSVIVFSLLVIQLPITHTLLNISSLHLNDWLTVIIASLITFILVKIF